MNGESESVASGALMQVLTSCNYQCEHCSQAAPRIGRSPTKQQVPDADRIYHRLDLLWVAGHRRVRFTGGEPFLRKDLPEIVEYAVQLGYRVSFVSNGALINEKSRSWLAPLAPLGFVISYYGYPPAVHDRLSGASGAFDRARRATRNLHADGHEVEAYFVLTASSMAGAPDFVQAASDFGVRRVKILQLSNQGRGTKIWPIEGTTDSSSLQSALEKVAMVARESRIDVEVSLKSGQRSLLEASGFIVPEKTTCKAGKSVEWTIGADGQVYSCCLLMNTGSLAVGGLEEAIEMPGTRYRWDLPARIAQENVKELPLRFCPALETPEDSSSDFMCPIMFAKLQPTQDRQ